MEPLLPKKRVLALFPGLHITQDKALRVTAFNFQQHPMVCAYITSATIFFSLVRST